MIIERTIVAVAIGVLTVSSAYADVHAKTIVRAVCANSSQCNVSGTLKVRAVNDAAGSTVQPMLGGTAAIVLDDRSSEWEIELAADGFWMPRQTLKAAEHERKIDVWRTTRLSGRFTAAGKTELPTTFEIALQSPLGVAAPVIAEGTSIACPVKPDGSWSCGVPAVRLDLIFRVRGFVPHYQWAVNLQPDAAKNFGTVVLRRGASVVAWIDRESLKQLKAPARARMMRAAMLLPSPIAQTLAQPVAEATFSDRGMVQLAPVPAGSYSLEVIAPGFATATVPQIEVYEGKESTLRFPIRLEPPLSVRVEVHPSRDPQGKPWRVSLSRVADFTGQYQHVARGETDETGSFSTGGQSPGKYHLWVKDSKGDNFISRPLTVRTEADSFISVDVATLSLQGRVTMGKRPIAGDLRFLSRTGGETITAKANSAGEFDIVLPRPGEWQVVIRQESEGIHATRKITVEPDSPIEIELPETEIAGWVIGPDGNRVSTAEVGILTDAGILDRATDATGSFRIRGVTPGPVRINARNMKTGEFSRVIEFEVKEDSRTEGIQLELDGLRKLRGSLLSLGLPVVGARLTGYGLTGGPARMRQTVSGLDGEFELSFPATAATVMLIVASPGRTLQAYTLVPTDERIQLDLAPVGGTIHLLRPEKTTRPLLSFNGTDIPMNDLAQWAAAQGRPLTGFDFEIPAMAPGPYRFCADVNGARACREGLLARGGSLSLAIE